MTRTTITTPDEPHSPNPGDRTRSSPRTSQGRKRANGEGTIYERKDGRYEGAAFVPTMAGTVKRVRLYGRTRDDVRRRAAKARRSTTTACRRRPTSRRCATLTTRSLPTPRIDQFAARTSAMVHEFPE
jgi:hypothetical protein